MSQIHSKFSSPSALRNRAPIANRLRDILPEKGTVLEIASGSGEHVIHFAPLFPNLTWQPSDPSPEARASVSAWLDETASATIMPPLDIDTTSDIWPIDRADAMIAINMIHISPWAATEGLFRGASRLLTSGAPVVLYGPYRQDGRVLVDSNAAFDASLRARNPEWGIRKLEDVASLAADFGFALESVTDMPANNLCVAFRRR
ncbi:DUF938 domain-containing protein [uncultured Cohaesibacter sp.]|uniref:DUF938 domain-containing protein n=1 Tax=uncultured Cohaesibacter sp. TaxID=1002546 RepID=UPI00292D03DA|nr:DUF938 domain-containing protein [uncultured Cohaesibacter sp.]